MGLGGGAGYRPRVRRAYFDAVYRHSRARRRIEYKRYGALFKAENQIPIIPAALMETTCGPMGVRRWRRAFGSAALPPSPRSPNMKPRANGTSACSLPLPFCRPASLRQSSIAQRLRISRSQILRTPCPIPGPSKSAELGSRCNSEINAGAIDPSGCDGLNAVRHVSSRKSWAEFQLTGGRQTVASRDQAGRALKMCRRFLTLGLIRPTF